MTTTSTAEPLRLTCPIPGCTAIVAAPRATDGVDDRPALAHAAEHSRQEVQFSDLIPTRFHCGFPGEHEAHVYGYGPRTECTFNEGRGDMVERTDPKSGSWVCPGIDWQAESGDLA
jgi:hypothetical protein